MYGLDENADRGTAGFADRLARGEVVRLFSDVLRNPIGSNPRRHAGPPCRRRRSRHPEHRRCRGRHPEDYGRRMLAFWGIDSNRIESIRATDISNSTPLDVRSRLVEGLLSPRHPLSRPPAVLGDDCAHRWQVHLADHGAGPALHPAETMDCTR